MSATIPSTDTFLALISPRLFRPFYTPNQMLEMGVFGGAFFGASNARKIYTEMNVELFRNIPLNKYSLNTYDATKNYFGVTPSGNDDRTYNMTVEQRMIHKFGWFEWYCRFYYGEKSNADQGRITQWMKEINRHFYYLKNGVYTGGGNWRTDLAFLPERRQRLLEFGVDPTLDPASYDCYYHF